MRLPDGFVLTTHGPDRRADHGTDIGLDDDERSPICGTDAYQQVLYGRPAGTADRSAEAIPQIVSAVRRMNAVLNEESLGSGGRSADYKVLCDKTGAMKIATFTTNDSTFYGIINAARRAGFKGRRGSYTDYTIFFDGQPATSDGDVCGLGSVTQDKDLAADNDNLTIPGYAVSYAGCWDGRTPMHEVGHTQGAVHDEAPFASGGGHCNEQIDVMCQADGGKTSLPVALLLCPEEMEFDCGHDTYFDSAPEQGEWLSKNWNLGSPLNKFIGFGGS